LVALGSFLPLLFIQSVAAKVVEIESPNALDYSRFSAWNYFGVLLGSCLLALFVLGLLYPELIEE